jgi:glycosyltransferase involved in cell wall biosynthesis
MMARAKGVKVVVDHDDNMFDISPMSPHYRDFGLEDIYVQGRDGKSQPMWIDGENFCIADNQVKIDGFKRSLEACDMVTTTTEILAKVYREYNDNVKVLPNCIDPDLWKSLPLVKEDSGQIKLHWGGGSSHVEDVMMVNDALILILKKYPHVKLTLAGCKWEGSLEGVRKDQIEFIPWTPTPAYPYRMAINNPDISFIPLVGNQFSACKSNIKWVEMASLGVPSVASFVSPYKESYDGANGVMVENTTEAWYEGLKLLITDPILRASMGAKAQKTAHEHFNINKQYVLWEQAYEELVNGN